MAETLYSARLAGPTILEKGRINIVACPVYREGLVVAPSGGTLTIWSGAGTVVVDGAAVTIDPTTGHAQYSVQVATLSSQAYSDGWRLEWSLAMPDGVTHVFRASGSLVYRRLYPVICDEDLYGRHNDLRARRPKGRTSHQGAVDEAWAVIEARLVKSGRRPYLILDPTALRDVHLALALALVFEDFATEVGGNDERRATTYRAQYEAAWGELSYPQATPEGAAETSNRRTSAQSTIWLCARSRR